jgi:hypothetical protein
MSLSPSTQQVSTVLNLCPQNRIFIFAETALIFLALNQTKSYYERTTYLIQVAMVRRNNLFQSEIMMVNCIAELNKLLIL